MRGLWPIRWAVFALVFGASLRSADAEAAQEAPWRLLDVVGAPSWIRLGLEHRVRVEHLEDDPRAPTGRSPSALSLRTSLDLALDLGSWTFGLELFDARIFATDSTTLNTTLVDALEVLRLYLRWRRTQVFSPGDSLTLQFGRMTMDLGSRRLLARNEFRNTINAFSGVSASWVNAAEHELRAFAVLPIERRPMDLEGLAENAVAFDLEDTNALLFGVFYASPSGAEAVQLNAYVLGFLERDASERPSADRRLLTPGLRILRASRPGRVDFELEAILQLGRSRQTSLPGDERDLDHRALSTHAGVGYRFDLWSGPRVVFTHDFASGDTDPADGNNERFDALFGARRFELGPTGLFGLVARSNLNSPALRVEFQPHRAVEAFAGGRLIWLAASKDPRTPLDPRGSSDGEGTFIGRQLEARIRWWPWPGNLLVELGGAVWQSEGPTALYVYSQITGSI